MNVQSILEEQVKWRDSRAWREHFWLLVIALPLMILYGLGLLIIFYILYDRSSREYVVTNRRVRARRGLLTRHTSEIDVEDIRDIQVHQSLWQRIIGTGDVFFGSAGRADMEVEFEGVAHPQRIKELVRDSKQLLREAGLYTNQ